MLAGGIDADAAALAARFADLGVRRHDQLGVLEARATLERVVRLQPPPAAVASVSDRLLPGAAGDLPARIYDPGADAGRPLILYLHGGGWALGSIAAADGPCRELAVASGCRVISLGYRLAPETPFPGPLDDCLAAARALIDDPSVAGAPWWSRLVLVGDSAGGNLAAAVALDLRDARPGAVLAQVLLYPCLHPAVESPFASYVEHADAPFMTARELAWFWDLYLPEARAGADPRAAPLLVEDVSGLPSTTILLAGQDPLHDEGMAYAGRLAEAAVPTRVTTWAGQPHGFWWMGAALPRAREVTETIAAAVSTAADGDRIAGEPTGRTT